MSSDVPVIVIFECSVAAILIKFFENQGYFPLYDYAHARDYQWFTKNVVHDHRLYTWRSDSLYAFQVEDLSPEMDFWPQFMICMQQDITASDYHWEEIANWLSTLLKKDHAYNPTPVMEIMKRPVIQKIVQEPASSEWVEVEANPDGNQFGKTDAFSGFVTRLPPNFKKPDGPYEFNKVYLEDRDTMLYQVNRPGTLLPFTVVVDHFQRRNLGHDRFFTDIYGSSEWGRNRAEHPYDYGYLVWQWKQLGLPGEFTMEVVKERVRRCYPDRLLEGELQEAEPVVYRRSIGNVINSLYDKDLGILTGDIPEKLKRRKVL